MFTATLFKLSTLGSSTCWRLKAKSWRVSVAAPCPLVFASHKLGRRWTLLVLRELLQGPRRFSNLQKVLPWIPAKSLARVLGKLEKDGLVERRVISTRPPKMTYSIVRNDPILREIIDALSRWGRENYHRRKPSR